MRSSPTQALGHRALIAFRPSLSLPHAFLTGPRTRVQLSDLWMKPDAAVVWPEQDG